LVAVEPQRAVAPRHARAHAQCGAVALEHHAVELRAGGETGARAEEARLDHVRSAVLGTEHVAVAALVARVGEVGPLLRHPDPRAASTWPLSTPATATMRRPRSRVSSSSPDCAAASLNCAIASLIGARPL